MSAIHKILFVLIATALLMAACSSDATAPSAGDSDEIETQPDGDQIDGDMDRPEQDREHENILIDGDIDDKIDGDADPESDGDNDPIEDGDLESDGDADATEDGDIEPDGEHDTIGDGDVEADGDFEENGEVESESDTDPETNDGVILRILKPLEGAVVSAGESVAFFAQVIAEDTDQLSFVLISNLDGAFSIPGADAEGALNAELTGLSTGAHTLTLRAIRNGTEAAKAERHFTVESSVSAPVVSIEPAAPTTLDDLVATASASGGGELSGGTLSFKWTVDQADANNTSDTVDHTVTAKGQIWRVKATFTTESGQSASAAASVTILNSPPTLATVSLTPDSTARDGEFTCNYDGLADVDETDAPVVSYFWYIAGENGERLPLDWNSQTLPASALSPGQALLCRVRPSDGEAWGDALESELAYVVNRLPSIDAVTLTPPSPAATDALHCQAGSIVDADDDDVAVAIAWKINGETVQGATSTTLGSGYVKGDQVACTVTLYDGFDYSDPLASNTVTIQNTVPQIISASVSGQSLCGDFQCMVSGVIDPDTADSVSYRYSWTVDDVTVNADTMSVQFDNLVGGEAIRCSVAPTDGEMDEHLAPIYGDTVETDPVIATNQRPVVASVALPAYGRPGDRLQCSVSASDDCTSPLDVAYTWMVNGVMIDGETDSRYYTAGLTTGDEVRCAAWASDGETTSSLVLSDPLTLLPSGWEITGSVADGMMGYSAAIADDLNGDGYAELVIGAPNADGGSGTQSGMVYFIYGRDDVDSIDVADLVDNAGGFSLRGESGDYDIAAFTCSFTSPGGCPTVTDVGGKGASDAGPLGGGFGFRVAYAGDITGDDVGDILISAPYLYINDLWQGRVYVVSGAEATDADIIDIVSAGGQAGYYIDGECGRRKRYDRDFGISEYSSAANGDLAGFDLAGAGDLNGDGLGDVIFSAINSGFDDEGVVYGVYGRSSFASHSVADIYSRGCSPDDIGMEGEEGTQVGVTVLGEIQGLFGGWGRFVGSAGDFNGDGYGDFVVHPPAFSGAFSFIVLGDGDKAVLDVDDLNWPDAIKVYNGDFHLSMTDDTFEGRMVVGFPIAGGGDMNADGLSDVCFSGRDMDNDGSLFCLFGISEQMGDYVALDNLVEGVGGFMISGSFDISSEWGDAAIIRDMNGDGYDEMVIGTGMGDGEVFLVWGQDGSQSYSIDDIKSGVGGFWIDGTDGERLGQSVSGGDLNGDGLGDLAISAPMWNSHAGRVLVEYGRDFDGIITRMGGEDADVLVGTSADESFIGGRGDDALSGGGGADVLYGGAGDDRIEIGDTAFRRIRGGPGTDTLVLAAGCENLDMANKRSLIEDIEIIELAGAQSLTISKIDIVRLSDTSNRLKVTGNGGTVATQPGEKWANGGIVSEDDELYLRLHDGFAELWIATNLSTELPPSVTTESISFVENSLNSSQVGSIEASDPDGGQLNFTLADSELPGALAVNATTGAITVADQSLLDYEADVSPFTIQVLVSDNAGLSTTAEIVVTLENVNEAPAFLASAYALTVEEGSGDDSVLGIVSAQDPDAEDTLTFTLSGSDAASLSIDPSSGEIIFPTGSSLDYETTPTLAFVVIATDARGLNAQAPVTVTVNDRDVIESHLSATFAASNRAIFQAGGASSFDGFQFEGLTENGATELCFTYAEGDYSWLGDMPVWEQIGDLVDANMAIDIAGTVCVQMTMEYSSGHYNASLPVDIDIAFPDEVQPGQSFEVSSSWSLSDGANFYGAQPYIQMGFGLRFDNFNILVQGCNGGSCDTLLDNTFTGEFYEEFGVEREEYTASLVNATDMILAPAETLGSDTLYLYLNWDDYLLRALSAMGYASNTGTFEYNINNIGLTDETLSYVVDYILFHVEFAYLARYSMDLQMDVNRLMATVTYENGETESFEVGTQATLTVPIDADINGDGKVETDIDFSLEAGFTNDFATRMQTGFFFTAGDFEVNATFGGNSVGPFYVGPIIDTKCLATEGDDGQDGNICLFFDTAETYTFQTNGWNTPSIVGTIDLME